MKASRFASIFILPLAIACGCSSTEKTGGTVAGAPPRVMGITDVAQMSQAHVSDDVIISQIHATGSAFQLSSTDLVWLKQNAVSDRVVAEMQATTGAVPGPGQAVVGAPVYVVDPPPPPVYVGFGYGYYRHRW